ncbi:hypothetical protein DESC_780272 [Desulfosarcina cetonica]|nr:hypothetical protein DESC_780272 [Desulfosarcina cetonica]
MTGHGHQIGRRLLGGIDDTGDHCAPGDAHLGGDAGTVPLVGDGLQIQVILLDELPTPIEERIHIGHLIALEHQIGTRIHIKQNDLGIEAQRQALHMGQDRLGSQGTVQGNEYFPVHHVPP